MSNAGSKPVPPTFLNDRIRSLKLYNANTILLISAVFAVMINFLCFFKKMIRKQENVVI